MITCETSPEAPVSEGLEAKAEPVLETLFLVARRADTLARHYLPASRETDRRVWLRAELEIFDATDVRRSALLVGAP